MITSSWHTLRTLLVQMRKPFVQRLLLLLLMILLAFLLLIGSLEWGGARGSPPVWQASTHTICRRDDVFFFRLERPSGPSRRAA